MECMDEDIKKLSEKIGFDLLTNNTEVRENKNIHDNKLSKLAIDNLCKYYQNTELKTLEVLLKYNFIDKKTYDEYTDFNKFM